MSEIEREDRPTNAHVPVDWQIPEGFPIDKIKDVPTNKIERIPYDEGMALFYRIMKRHSNLFRKLATL